VRSGYDTGCRYRWLERRSDGNRGNSCRYVVRTDSCEVHSDEQRIGTDGGEVQCGGIWKMSASVLSGTTSGSCWTVWHSSHQHRQVILSKVSRDLLSKTCQTFKYRWKLLWNNISTSSASNLSRTSSYQTQFLLRSKDLWIQDPQELNELSTSSKRQEEAVILMSSASSAVGPVT